MWVWGQLLWCPLQRSNKPYIESIIRPVFLRMRKEFSPCRFNWEENPEGRLGQ